MTAEIAIANSGAVSLAADSAVTIGGVKIYNSANKLFALSKTEPIGIMVFGNASLMGIPWETIIKIYRKKNNKTFKKLEFASDDFIDFLENRFKGFTAESQKDDIKANVIGYYSSILDAIKRQVEEKIKATGSINRKQSLEIFKNVVGAAYNNISIKKRLPKYTKKYEDDFKKKYLSLFRNAVKDVFEKFSITQDSYTKLYFIATLLHSRDIFSSAKTGVVLAGFGEDEIFPVIRTYDIDGYYNGKLKYKFDPDKSEVIKNGNNSTVIPFAQEDMVGSFMQGVNPSVHIFIIKYLNRIFERLPELVNKKYLAGDNKKKEDFLKNYKSNINKLLKVFFEQLSTHTQIEHINPVMHMVNALPKDELAEMAEALVSLTAFKMRITKSLETVGGPIDVAVISKGDGFVWVKRKDYYPKELNYE